MTFVLVCVSGGVVVVTSDVDTVVSTTVEPPITVVAVYSVPGMVVPGSVSVKPGEPGVPGERSAAYDATARAAGWAVSGMPGRPPKDSETVSRMRTSTLS